jgi:hypothetical protein
MIFIVIISLFILKGILLIVLAFMQELCFSQIIIENTKEIIKKVRKLDKTEKEIIIKQELTSKIDNSNEALKLIFANIIIITSIIFTIYVYSALMIIESSWNMIYIIIGFGLSIIIIILGITLNVKFKDYYDKLAFLISKILGPTDEKLILDGVKAITNKIQEKIKSKIMYLLKLASSVMLVIVLMAYIIAAKSINFDDRISYVYHFNHVLEIFLLLPQFATLSHNHVLISNLGASIENMFNKELDDIKIEKIQFNSNWTLEIHGWSLNTFTIICKESYALLGDNASKLLKELGGIITYSHGHVKMNHHILSQGFRLLLPYTIYISSNNLLPGRKIVGEILSDIQENTIENLMDVVELKASVFMFRETRSLNHEEIQKLRIMISLAKLEKGYFELLLLDNIDIGIQTIPAARIVQRILYNYRNRYTILMYSDKQEIVRLLATQIRISNVN